MDVMIDIETLSQRKTAAIISIGAVKFDKDTVYDTFYVNVDPVSCKELGLHFQKETIEWWMTQSKEARDALKVAKQPIETALTMFSEWYGPKSLPTWSNGATFDLVIVENAFQALGKPVPWKYWHERCFRTMKGIFNYKASDEEKAGVLHNALDDAKNQVKILQNIFNS